MLKSKYSLHTFNSQCFCELFRLISSSSSPDGLLLLLLLLLLLFMNEKETGCIGHCNRGPNVRCGEGRKVYHGIHEPSTVGAILAIECDSDVEDDVISAYSKYFEGMKCVGGSLKAITAFTEAIECKVNQNEKFPLSASP